MRCFDSRCKQIMFLKEEIDLVQHQEVPCIAKTYNCTCGISVVVNIPANYEDRYYEDAS